ncbi:hypothetical protein NPIL_395161 [Nephila pilipes]|uniref:Uncharacterized protein n=1 Tax=Nephila pilipes TaxID=299642 RepID=A0A8X6PBK1_NEPPI|nr:hypothetical protein NPIL_395161 [Nephila pilipes]
METLTSESSAGTSSARKAGRRLGLPPSSIRNILHGALNQYPYKLQSSMTFYCRITERERSICQTFGEERITSKLCKFSWPPRSLDLTQAVFCLRRYVNSRVYRSHPFNLLDLKDVKDKKKKLSYIQLDILHSAVAGFMTCLQYLLW